MFFMSLVTDSNFLGKLDAGMFIINVQTKVSSRSLFVSFNPEQRFFWEDTHCRTANTMR